MKRGPAIGADLFSPPKGKKTPQRSGPSVESMPVPAIPPGGRACFVCGAYAPFGMGNLREPAAFKWTCREHRKALG